MDAQLSLYALTEKTSGMIEVQVVPTLSHVISSQLSPSWRALREEGVARTVVP